MGYQGDIMTVCDPEVLTFTRAYAVLVSGDGPNFCGHALLKTSGGPKTHYFQVAGIRDYPRYMDQAGFDRYLSENGKTLWMVIDGNITHPLGAQKMLEQLMFEKWLWGVLPHNCVTFVEQVIDSGGGDFALTSNCAFFPRIEDEAMRGLGNLERRIRWMYGVPTY